VPQEDARGQGEDEGDRTEYLGQPPMRMRGVPLAEHFVQDLGDPVSAVPSGLPQMQRPRRTRQSTVQLVSSVSPASSRFTASGLHIGLQIRLLARAFLGFQPCMTIHARALGLRGWLP
jgi:hypothetical protein